MDKFWRRAPPGFLLEMGDDASLSGSLPDTELKHGDTGEDVIFIF